MRPFLVWAVFMGALIVAAGCATYEQVADAAAEKGCSPEGQTARSAYRAARDSVYRAKDRAICMRCPGEEALKCTGDPKTLPVQ